MHSVKWENWKGGHRTPFTIDELTSKYRDATGETLSPRQVDRSIELVLNLDNLNDVSELMGIVTFPD